MIHGCLGIIGLRLITILNPKQDDDENKLPKQYQRLREVEYVDHRQAISNSTDKILASMLKDGSPGMTVCIAKRGKIIWRSGFGYCDVENLVPCDEFAAMKIASISKSIFALTMVAPLIEQNKLNLRSSVHDFLSKEEFPRQKFQGEEFDITVKQLLSHTSGIRHYKEAAASLKPIGSSKSKKINQNECQYLREDGFVRETYRDVMDALKIFKNDQLTSKPGEFNYTTYGYTLLSAVVQKVLQSEPDKDKVQVEDEWIRRLRTDLKLTDTYLDQDEIIISRRARHYQRAAENGGLINVPYLDTSYKWAGGGLVSNTTDMIKFANNIFDLYNGRNSRLRIKRETLDLMWTEVEKNYALGFVIGKDDENERVIYHTGCSIGSSTLLMMKPESEIAVAIMTNLPNIGLVPLGLYIAEQFRDEQQ